MPSNVSTDSISDISTSSSESDLENPFDADRILDEVADFYQKTTISTTRRLPAKNVPRAGAPYVFETTRKTTKTVISYSLTPPIEMLKKSRHGRASACVDNTTRCDGENPASVAPPPQAEMAETQVPMSAPSPAIPAPIRRPIIRVYGDDEDMPPDHPKYPEGPSTNLNVDAAVSPRIPTANHAATQGHAAPTVSLVSSTSQAPQAEAPQAACPWGNSIATAGNLPVSSASAMPRSPLAPPGAAAPASRTFVTATDNGTAARLFVTAADSGAAARPSGTFVAAAGGQVTATAPTPSASQGARSEGSQAASSTPPFRPSARGSKLRFAQIQEVLGENENLTSAEPSAP